MPVRIQTLRFRMYFARDGFKQRALRFILLGRIQTESFEIYFAQGGFKIQDVFCQGGLKNRDSGCILPGRIQA